MVRDPPAGPLEGPNAALDAAGNHFGDTLAVGGLEQAHNSLAAQYAAVMGAPSSESLEEKRSPSGRAGRVEGGA
eukprot:15459745-Alexandrium_andersonii.AAC.1